MADTAAIRAHWDQQASKGEKAGTQDLILKELERRAISGAMSEAKWGDSGLCLEVGCGRGEMSRELATRYPGRTFEAADNSLEMIAEAMRGDALPNLRFGVCDVMELPHRGSCGVVISERCLINLPTWELQHEAIDRIAEYLAPGGTFLMCEHSQDAVDVLNAARGYLDLPEIRRPNKWNRYFHHDELHTITSLKLIRSIPFSATYYWLSRVINAKLAADKGEQPDYDSRVNQLALTLPYWSVDPKFAQGRLFVWEKP